MHETQKVEWPTLGLIIATYGVWVVSGAFIWPQYPALALVLMALASAQHSSLVHEAVHGHPTRIAWLNEALVSVCPSLIWPYRRFRSVHLRHHTDARLTDPFDDPESHYRALWRYNEMPRWMRVVLAVNNTLVGRLVLGPILGTVGLLTSDTRAILSGDRKILLAWVLHLSALVPVLACVILWFAIPLWLYLICVAWASASLISLRTFAEHQWAETPEGRTIIVESSPFSFLFLFNNLHIVHHRNPQAPWYAIPALYKADPAYWRELNGGYFFRNYWQLIRAYAFVAKEPVCHPEWRREEAE